MEENAADDLTYFLCLEDKDQNDLSSIRHWDHLKVAFKDTSIWIKGFDYVQINSKEVKSIPFKTLFYSSKGKLFILNSLLPDRNIPALLWTPIERALPVKFSSFNHNFFGINEKISPKLIPSDNEAEAEAMITDIQNLTIYLDSAPGIRLKDIKWTLLNNDKVLLIGKRLLPMEGDTFWKRGNFLIAAGFDINLYLLTDTLNVLLNPQNDHYIIWEKNGNCSTIDKSDFEQLSLGSFRKTIQTFLQP